MSWLWSARFIIVKIGAPVASSAWRTLTFGSIAAGFPASSVVGNRLGISCFSPAGTGNSTSRRVAGCRLSQAATAAFAIWEEWLAQRPRKQRDKDGLELLRASAWDQVSEQSWAQLLKTQGPVWGKFLRLTANGLKPVTVRHAPLVGKVLQWLLRLHPPAGAVEAEGNAGQAEVIHSWKGWRDS